MTERNYRDRLSGVQLAGANLVIENAEGEPVSSGFSLGDKVMMRQFTGRAEQFGQILPQSLPAFPKEIYKDVLRIRKL